VSTETRTDQAYRHIQSRIFSGALPPGSIVSEHALAKDLGFSRTPVGKAIRQLVHDGLMEQVPRYGTIVRTLDRQEIVDLYELRGALETFAVEKAIRQMRQEEVALLRSLCNQMRQVGREMKQAGRATLDGPAVQKFLTADMAFHMVIIRAAGNHRITKIVAEGRILSQVVALQTMQFDLRVIAQAYRFHRRILRTVERKNGAIARHWMQEHVRAGLKDALLHYDRWRADQAWDQTPLCGLTGGLCEKLAGTLGSVAAVRSEAGDG
jgi:DNA-binding GntR family transcriptional regulator